MVTFDEPRDGGGANNPYEFNARATLQLYGAFVEGRPGSTLAVVSGTPLSEAARKALEASAERLGFGRDACAWVVLSAEGENLGASDLHTLVEGLDPTAVVAADGDAASLLSQAFDATLVINAANRAACRTVVALSDFEAALEDPDAKQKAWAVLKKLRRSF